MAEAREKLLGPVASQSVWRGRDLVSDESWVIHVSADEAEELMATLAMIKKKAKRAAEFKREDFPLPSFSTTLARVQDELEHGRGFVLIRGLPFTEDDEGCASKLLWGVSCYLGHALRQHPRVNSKGFKDDLIGCITDQGLDYNQPNVHGSATSAEQMPHCDPADVVALLCVRPAKEGGISSIVSAMTIYNQVLARHPELLDTLYKGFYHDLRNQQANGVNSSVTPRRIPVFSYFHGQLSCNFNSKTILTALNKMETSLTDTEQAALNAMSEIARDPALRLDMRLETGDLQLLNNYVILHSRTSWVDDNPARKRLMLRLWLKLPNARPLAPDFSGGYVTGTYYDVTKRQLRSPKRIPKER